MLWDNSPEHARRRVKVGTCRRLLQRQMAGLDHEKGKRCSYVWTLRMHTSGVVRSGVHLGLEAPIVRKIRST